MKKSILMGAVALLIGGLAHAVEQNYLLGTDEAAPQKSPTIEARVDGVYVVIMTNVEGHWVKYTLTPTDETRYGAFGEPVVKLTDIVPLP